MVVSCTGVSTIYAASMLVGRIVVDTISWSLNGTITELDDIRGATGVDIG